MRDGVDRVVIIPSRVRLLSVDTKQINPKSGYI